MKKSLVKFLSVLLLSVSVFSSGLVYGENPWSINEDSALLSYVSKIGENWLLISKKWIYGKRAPGEFKERYCYLSFWLSKVWKQEEIDTLHRKVLSSMCDWKVLGEYFNVPAAIVVKKYYETLKEYRELMNSMEQDCMWLPRQMWVDDVDLSD